MDFKIRDILSSFSLLLLFFLDEKEVMLLDNMITEILAITFKDISSPLACENIVCILPSESKPLSYVVKKKFIILTINLMFVLVEKPTNVNRYK
jgi:hypothetical protein